MRSHKVVRNALYSVLYRVVLLMLQFVARKIFIMYLGSELLGLNSLYVNLLDLLNLSELGIGVAVQFNLYKPIVNKDIDKIAGILQSAKKLYTKIGVLVFVAGILISFFIQYFIKDNVFPIWFIQIAFVTNVIGTASSYFFVHKRLFLQANEEIFITNIVDMIFSVLFTIFKIILVVLTENYFIYLAVDILQKLASNIFINIIFNKKYGTIIRSSSKDETLELMKDIKNVIPLKLGNYIYSSTDSIVISKFMGLIAVNLYSNYIMIFNQIFSFSALLADAIKASYGKKMKETENKQILYDILQEYMMLQFFISSVCSVLLYTLIDDFIIWWLGKDYLISQICTILLTLDFFVHSMFQPLSAVYAAAGKFKDDKKITILMAVLNIILSVASVRSMGLAGVILGTFASNCVCMVFRIYQIVYKFFENNVMRFVYGIVRFHVLAFIEVALGSFLYRRYSFIWNNSLLGLIIPGIILALAISGINCLFFRKTSEYNKLLQRVIMLIHKK